MSLKEIEGIYVSEDTLRKFSEFEKHYIDVRTKERRVLSLQEIKQLPFVDKKLEYYHEWKLRQKSINRFLQYLNTKKRPLRILDIGCGNGFLTHLLAKDKHVLVGVDVGLTELKQAALAFAGENLKWYCLDIENESLPEGKFDIITFNSSFQYFEDPSRILEHCKRYLNSNGEIHIMDSPFYQKETIEDARQRSVSYYTVLNSQQMTEYYYHHDIDVLNKFNTQLMYDPDRCWFKSYDSPFLWIKIV